MERLILDTSVLIDPVDLPEDAQAAISAVSIAELHFGLLVADETTRPLRAARLGLIESRFTPLPLDDKVAREWGRLQAAVASRDANPRKRSADLAIAATANVHEATLLTRNLKDFTIIEDLLRVSGV
ncbi:PIN domain-containing protein [Conexibacter sp. DBS9H8]|uniref:PIN domain-containing protein n=1 Tax=Conexibacter sp. DBS9H8 TaxID=2937801 RepID=UPI002112F876|nr:PIN domain-containing protein [Conexibacter sp. DBS9H8]